MEGLYTGVINMKWKYNPQYQGKKSGDGQDETLKEPFPAGNMRYMDYYASGYNDLVFIMEWDHDEYNNSNEFVLWNYTWDSGDSLVSLSGLTSNRITWAGNAGEMVYCNATGDAYETLNITINPSGTDILEVRIFLGDMNDTSAYINASNVTMYVSIDNATWHDAGTFSDGGSNITLNADTWTWANDPFPISSDDWITCRFKLSIPSGQSALLSSASSTAWKVYILG